MIGPAGGKNFYHEHLGACAGISVIVLGTCAITRCAATDGRYASEIRRLGLRCICAECADMNVALFGLEGSAGNSMRTEPNAWTFILYRLAISRGGRGSLPFRSPPRGRGASVLDRLDLL